MKQFAPLTIALVVLLALPSSPGGATFEGSVKIVPVEYPIRTTFIYAARSTGDIYLRAPGTDWAQPPTYVGNFFFGQAVPADFLSGFQIAATATGVLYYYASSTGDVFLNVGQPIGNPPSNIGRFFFDYDAPSDFQQGFHIVTWEGSAPTFYYTSLAGEVYRQDTAPWDGPPGYRGSFFAGMPVSTSKSTLGGVKSKYR